MIAMTQFFLGFSLLWNNKLEESITVMNQSLELAIQTGDIIIKTRNLTYLTVAHRRLGNLPEVELYARQSMTASQQAGMFEYLGSASANLTWLAWKNKELDKVEIMGRQAFDFWERLTETHSSLVFVWMAAFPLIAMYCQQGNLSKCIEYFEMMLKPGRKRFEPELEQSIKEVVAKFNTSASSLLHQDVKNVLDMSERFNYL